MSLDESSPTRDSREPVDLFRTSPLPVPPSPLWKRPETMTLAVDMSVLLRLSFAHFLFDPLLFLCVLF